jgi:hypothetical protein
MYQDTVILQVRTLKLKNRQQTGNCLSLNTPSTSAVNHVQAWHSVKDDPAFLWKHGKFGYPPNLYPLTDQNENLQN